MITIISGIVMLGILVFVHELGHFMVAKWSGVKVLKFSLGFGPKLVARTWGETEYLICAIPLGGYVQMLGEGGGEQGEEAALSEEEKQRSFAEKPVSKRLAIVAAGPLMNLILPFLVLPITYLVGVQMPVYFDQPACVGYVVADSEASTAGFVRNDCILSLNGESLQNWNDTNKALIGWAGDPLVFQVERGGERLSLEFSDDNSSLEGLQALGLLPQQAAVIGALAPGMPAEKAGVVVGDRILQIGEIPIGNWYDLKETIQKTGGNEVQVILERDGEQFQVRIAPEQRETEGAYLIGIGPQTETVLKRFGPVEAFEEGAKRTVELVELTLVFIQKLFTGSVSAKNIGGPITVVQVAGQAAQTDISAVLSVLAFISIQLGILNLLPIPVLDGGHIFFFLLEILFRRPPSLKIKEVSQQIGLMLLLMLMVLAIYNDISRLWLG